MNRTTASMQCLCGGERFIEVFTYTAPPKGETQFPFSGADYHREVWACQQCGHLLSRHDLGVDGLYTDTYVHSTYGEDGLQHAFERIISLDPLKSDNTGRVKRLLEFGTAHFARSRDPRAPRTILDVGSGLCVFLHRMKMAGWDCTAIDPDPHAVAHARDRVGVAAHCGDFMTVHGLGWFDVVALNKVLEHVIDPITMLSRVLTCVKPDGFVYVELPDGEVARRFGPGREEFFIEHWHMFSPVSLAVLASRAGFDVRALERLQEPSGKYTLRAFLAPRPTEGE